VRGSFSFAPLRKSEEKTLTIIDSLERQRVLVVSPCTSDVHDFEHGPSNDRKSVGENTGSDGSGNGASGKGAHRRPGSVPEVLLVSIDREWL